MYMYIYIVNQRFWYLQNVVLSQPTLSLPTMSGGCLVSLPLVRDVFVVMINSDDTESQAL